MNKKIFIATLVLGLVLALPVSAAVIRAGNDYVLPGGEALEGNTYVFAGTTNISGDVEGDLLVVSGDVIITGLVTEDVTVIGGTVNILGDIGGDLRALGGSISVSGFVGGEVLAMGGNVNIMSTAEVDGDLLVSGGKVTVDGLINGMIGAKSGEVSLNGQIIGNVNIKSVKRLALGDGVVIGGDLTYRSPEEISVPDGIVGGNINFDQIVRKTSSETFDVGAFTKLFFGIFWVISLLKLGVLIVTALLAVHVVNKASRKIVENGIKNFWSEALRGLVVAIIVPIIAFLLLLTVLGSMIGVIVGLVHILLILIGYIYTGVLFGSWLFGLASKKKEIRMDWLSTLTGVVLMYIVSLIPFLGWLATLVFVLAAYGSVVHLFHNYLWSKR